MRSLVPYLPLMALSAVLSAVDFASTYRVGAPASGFWITLAPGLFLLAWMLGDARGRRRVPCHEFGFLAGVFLPASLAWYVVWSRGWRRGLGLLVGLVGLLVLPGVAEVVARLIAGRG